MEKKKMMINFSTSTLLLLFLLVSTGLMKQGEAQAKECVWECKHLPNFPCWLGDVGKGLCNDLCKSEGADSGICVANPHGCLCRKAGCF